MAYNSVLHAVHQEQRTHITKRALKSPVVIDAKPPQIIVVVGAGASNAACDLPNGKEAAKELRSDINVSFEIVDKEIARIALQYNLLEEDFETVLLALAKFDRPRVLQRLAAIYGRRHHPWIGYELLAHFLKHRFVDAVVNFNFDEILDQAISDELMEAAYYRVVLDGDCPPNLTDWIDSGTGKFRLPLYLKPHGTASQPSSLRFTRESYAALPEEFVELLLTLLDPERKTYILVLGFAMQSVEFNHLLRRSSQGRDPSCELSLYFVKKLAGDELRFRQGMAGSHREFIPEKDLEIAGAVEALWEYVSDTFKDPYRPRGIARHKLVSEFFKGRKIRDWKLSGREPQERRKRRLDYFRARTYIEITLAIAKAKGFAAMEDLANGRVGTYFRLYREEINQAGAPLTHSDPFRSLESACTRLGLVLHGYGTTAVTFKRICNRNDENESRSVYVGKSEFKQEAKSLVKSTLEAMLGLVALPDNLTAAFMDALMRTHGGDEVEVDVPKGENHTLSLERPMLLTSLSALKFRTEELMERKAGEWDTLACTAKSGEWLLNDVYRRHIEMHNAIVTLVVSDVAFEGKLRATYQERLCDPVHWLPWWMHNQNVTVFLRGEAPVFALAFERRLRTARITPYYLERGDAEASWRTFVAYWLKAERRELGRPDGQITTKDLDLTRAQLFERFHKHRRKLVL